MLPAMFKANRAYIICPIRTSGSKGLSTVLTNWKDFGWTITNEDEMTSQEIRYLLSRTLSKDEALKQSDIVLVMPYWYESGICQYEMRIARQHGIPVYGAWTGLLISDFGLHEPKVDKSVAVVTPSLTKDELTRKLWAAILNVPGITQQQLKLMYDVMHAVEKNT